ncbi:hypothetical protein V5O48_019644, partial [Marasmius crinis-equi]
MGSLGARKTQLHRFAIKLNWVLPDDTALCMPGVIKKMQKMENLERLEMDLGHAEIPIPLHGGLSL